MRECRSSGSVEGVMGNHGSYSDSGRMSMAAYSLDLRKRVLRAWDGGMDAESVAAKYEVSRAWVHRLGPPRRETGSLAPPPQTQFPGPRLARPGRRVAAPRAPRPLSHPPEVRTTP